jgi:hypothetical protein
VSYDTQQLEMCPFSPSRTVLFQPRLVSLIRQQTHQLAQFLFQKREELFFFNLIGLKKQWKDMKMKWNMVSICACNAVEA